MESDDQVLIARVQAVKAKRGFLLPHHGLLAAMSETMLAHYDALYTALALEQKVLDERAREFVWLCVLIATDEAIASHHIAKFRQGGGTAEEIATAIRLTAWAVGAPAYTFIAEHWANATWLVKSLAQRASTILKVAAEIARQQDAFLRHGITHLRPLILRDIATAVELHESTVSRVTANKYIATPRGTLEMKFFFTTAIAGTTGEAHSSESVRHRIRELIAGEDPEAVLSDDQIVAMLKREGVDIARRTVAKYREGLGIPSSVQRRREKAIPA